jgi:hypothetical protein
MKNKNLAAAARPIFIFAFLISGFLFARAQDAKAPDGILKESVDKYFSERKYNECAQYLESLINKDGAASAELSYFLALTRYSQLKYLEESQDWNEYFNSGNDYREQAKSYARAAITATSAKDAVNISSRLLLWKMYKDQDSPEQQEALGALVNAALENNDAGLLKDTADSLTGYGEKAHSRRLYNAYVEKLTVAKISDAELKATAADFYKQKNLALCEALYDAYISRISASLPKEKLAPELRQIAQQFVYSPEPGSDMFYAEKVFDKLDQLVGNDGFDEPSLYSRAFNLEKSKEFLKAKSNYLSLVSRFPEGIHLNEALYKSGMICVYALRNLKEGREQLEKLAAKEALDPQVVSALYQLGLLSQWEGDAVKAKQYYTKLTEVAKDGYAEKTSLAKIRLKELSEAKPLDYNLNLFLDVALKQENAVFDAGKADLVLTPYLLNKNENLSVVATASAGDSGCMPVGLQYIWSGDLGSASVTPEQHTFETVYSESGAKTINLVVVSPAGVVGRSFDIADIR